jgi:hypothetical protein
MKPANLGFYSNLNEGLHFSFDVCREIADFSPAGTFDLLRAFAGAGYSGGK